MKIPLEIFVIWEHEEWMDAPQFSAWSCDVSKTNPSYALVTTATVEVEIPDDFDPVPQRIATLKNERQRILAEAEVKANNIEDQIRRLLCIEHKPEASNASNKTLSL